LASSRIEILRQLLEQNPASAFARYGLAMEYVKAGELETAVAEFEAVAAARRSDRGFMKSRSSVTRRASPSDRQPASRSLKHDWGAKVSLGFPNCTQIHDSDSLTDADLPK
jgi:cytochrome c-type biogenesis protein CcmH/NrfG